MSLTAYQKAQSATETPRDVEYRLFAQVTSALTRAKEHGTRDGEYVKALDWNRRMWSTFTSDCSAEGNQLPKDLRARIISIGMWVSRYTSDVIRNGADIDALIDVNRAIMEGLAARAVPQPQAQYGAAPQGNYAAAPQANTSAGNEMPRTPMRPLSA
ncbi:flagellar biosynthesis regulator FlaF [Govanella unica]|uniref:Flagellar biosynthesis regulator FlaF n=1 Tax=Govanella unica TaxID=2975056 RepID=A0A9X3TWD5_9PROT|nr:flagellar biosynthesis regulator FlaF [Govania unica]MDA5193205.1 flagellar biosynthesis regulator FlaF [Govania unica]